MKTTKTSANSKENKLLLPLKFFGTILIGLFIGYQLNSSNQNFSINKSNKRSHATHYQRAEEILRFIDARYVEEQALDSLQMKARQKSLF